MSFRQSQLQDLVFGCFQDVCLETWLTFVQKRLNGRVRSLDVGLYKSEKPALECLSAHNGKWR